MEITKTLASRVLEVVDAGLSHGLGTPKPGEMCVEAAVCYALGEPHGDNPSCVANAVRSLKIRLNDSQWSSNKIRASGMRRLAVAQLGSAGVVNDNEFVKSAAELAIRLSVPVALRAAASLQKDHYKTALLDAASRCEKEGTQEAASEAASAAASVASGAARAARAAWAASEAANGAASGAAWAASGAAWAASEAASGAASDKHLGDFAEGVVQILIRLESPGCKYLFLTEP